MKVGPHRTELPDLTLIKCIGKGSFGTVFLAQDRLGRWRAVKVIEPVEAGAPGAIRTEREFAGLRRYEPVSREHPNLLDILFVGTDPASGALYYVMELADHPHREAAPPASTTAGESTGDPEGRPPDGGFDAATYEPDTLRRRISDRQRRHEPSERRLPAAEVLYIGRSLADALACLHKAGLVHRDIKPDNVVFVSGKPCLADSGLVAESAAARTFVGTEGFIPPEGPGTPTADLFALAKTLYEAGFGLDRVDWPDLPIWYGHTTDASLLRGLREVLLRALAREPLRRYPDATEMAADLERVALGRPVQSPRPSRQTRRLGIAVGAVALIAAGAFLAPPRSRSRPSVETLPIQNMDYQGLLPFGMGTNQAQPGFFAARGAKAFLLGPEGEVVVERSVRSPVVLDLTLQAVGDVNGDGAVDGLYTWNDGETPHISAFSQYPLEFIRYSPPGMPPRPASSGISTAFFPVASTRLRGPGRNELLALLETKSSKSGIPTRDRRLLAFDGDHGDRLWELEVVQCHSRSIAVLPGSGPTAGLLLGTFSSDNGHVVSLTTTNLNGRLEQHHLNDSHAYLYSMDPSGKVHWIRETGDIFVECWPKCIPRKGTSDAAIVALTWANSDARSSLGLGEVGSLHRYSRLGELEARDERPIGIETWMTTDLDDDGQPDIVVADMDGRVRALNLDLKTFRETTVARRRYTRVQMQWIGEADFDGDGKQELALAVCHVEATEAANFGREDGPGKLWRFHDAEIVLLDRKLNLLDRVPTARLLNRNPFGFTHIDRSSPGATGARIINVASGIQVIRFASKAR